MPTPATWSRCWTHSACERTVVVGHSMGAFVALVLGDLHPDRVSRLVLVDGVCRWIVPDGLDRRRGHQFVSRPDGRAAGACASHVEAYLDFWRAHPAFRRDWSPELEAYLAYDLVGGRSPSCGPRRATRHSKRTRSTEHRTALVDALARLRHPTVLLTAERGLLDQVAAALPPDRAARPAARRTRASSTCGSPASTTTRSCSPTAGGACRGRARAGRGRRGDRSASSRSGRSSVATPAAIDPICVPAGRVTVLRRAMRVVSWCACARSVRPSAGRRSGPNRNSTPVRLSAHSGWPSLREDRGAEAVAALDDQPGVERVTPRVRVAKLARRRGRRAPTPIRPQFGMPLEVGLHIVRRQEGEDREPAEATPSGKRTPSDSTKDRIGKLPSSAAGRRSRLRGAPRGTRSPPCGPRASARCHARSR